MYTSRKRLKLAQVELLEIRSSKNKLQTDRLHTCININKYIRSLQNTILELQITMTFIIRDKKRHLHSSRLNHNEICMNTTVLAFISPDEFNEPPVSLYNLLFTSSK